MFKREKELFLVDIIVAIEKIKLISSKFNRGEDLKYNFLHWDAIIREFEIIGEAMKYCIQYGLFEDDKEKRKVIDFRNILTHKYFGIDADAVLDIAKNNLDSLEELVTNRFLEVEKVKRDEILDYLIEENRYLPFVVDKLKSLKDESK